MEKLENKITIILNNYKENEQLIKELLINKNNEINYKSNIDTKIFILLTKLGMPSNLHGHRYIVTAIKLCFEGNENYLHLSANLYPTISKIFNVKDYMVEKSIRDAITITWNRGNYDYQRKLFGYTVDREKGKPTNGEFIAQIVNYLNTI